MRTYCIVFAFTLFINQSLCMEQNSWDFINNAFQHQFDKLALMFNPSELSQTISDVYDIFSQNENYRRKWKLRHEKYGAFRSGEGTKAEIMARLKNLEEQQMLNELQQNRTIVTDYILSKKLYSNFQKNFSQHSVRDDKFDLIPHHKIASPYLSLT